MDPVGFVINNLSRGLARGMQGSKGANLIGHLFSKELNYFTDVCLFLHDIVEEDLTEDLIHRTNIQIDTVVQWVLHQYLPMKKRHMFTRLTQEVLRKELERQVNEKLPTLIATLTTKELRASTLVPFTVVASLHLALLQEIVILDEVLITSPMTSQYVHILSSKAAAYCIHLNDAYDLCMVTRVAVVREMKFGMAPCFGNGFVAHVTWEDSATKYIYSMTQHCQSDNQSVLAKLKLEAYNVRNKHIKAVQTELMAKLSNPPGVIECWKQLVHDNHKHRVEKNPLFNDYPTIKSSTFSPILQ